MRQKVEKLVNVVYVERLIRPFAVFFVHIEVRQIARRQVVVVAELRVEVGVNPGDGDDLDSALAVFLVKRRDDQVHSKKQVRSEE